LYFCGRIDFGSGSLAAQVLPIDYELISKARAAIFAHCAPTISLASS